MNNHGIFTWNHRAIKQAEGYITIYQHLAECFVDAMGKGSMTLDAAVLAFCDFIYADCGFLLEYKQRVYIRQYFIGAVNQTITV